MSILEIFLLAVSLCFDTLAVSIVGGACITEISVWKRVKILLSFALFQAGFTLIGWLLGSTVSQYIEKFDHWIAFGLLAYIGGKMIIDAFSKAPEAENCSCETGGHSDLLDTKRLIISSIATSIDALAVGISLAFIQMSVGRISLTVGVIGAVTALAAALGLRGGKKLGNLLGNKCNFIGGLILVALGLKILLEHLLS